MAISLNALVRRFILGMGHWFSRRMVVASDEPQTFGQSTHY